VGITPDQDNASKEASEVICRRLMEALGKRAILSVIP